MEIKEIQAKSILQPCGIPGIDYVINPYTGCRFGCTYCYASFMGRFLKDKTIADWGEYVHVKMNAPDLLEKRMKRLKNKGEGKEIFFSSVTDPYQGAEAKYKLTRQCLQIIADSGFKGYVSILTKSDLVLRDIDVLKKLKNVAVGLTITSTDDSISRYFEKYAPNVSDRFKALKTLNNNNIQTYAFIGPLLPHFVAFEGELEKIFKKLAETGTKDLFVEHLNLSNYIRNRLTSHMKKEEPELINKFYDSQSKQYREVLDDLVNKYVKKYGMNLLTGGTIYHKEYQPGSLDKNEPWKQSNKS
jgi:DNA repair photolyase